jgi:hypothetical protein
MPNRGFAADTSQMKRFMRDLRKVSPELQLATRRRFRGAVSRVVIPEAKRRAPRKSGRLARSIKPSTAVRTGAAMKSSLPYSALNEYGGRHRVFGRDEWVAQKPRPYMRPAAILKRNEFYREANEAVNEAARKAGFR